MPLGLKANWHFDVCVDTKTSSVLYIFVPFCKYFSGSTQVLSTFSAKCIHEKGSRGSCQTKSAKWHPAIAHLSTWEGWLLICGVYGIRYSVHGYTTRIYQVLPGQYLILNISAVMDLLRPTPRVERVAEIGRAHGLAARISPCGRLRSTVWLFVPCCSARHADIASWITSYCCGNRKGLGGWNVLDVARYEQPSWKAKP